MRVCLVYDCLYPHTVGGVERWYRALAERLATEGHDVDYVTLRQWGAEEDPGVPGVRVVAVGPRMPLYTGGRRRIVPPLVFGAGVLWHLLRHGRRYHAVHTASFPFFSVLAAAAARRLHRFELLVDWFEVWTLEYWRQYIGRFPGRVGFAVQRACIRVPQRAFCFSRLHMGRLRAEGVRVEPTFVGGLLAGRSASRTPLDTPAPVAVFAGRHIPEKRVPALVDALDRARREVPELRGRLLGDGPERPEVLRRIAAAGLGPSVEAPGFVDADEVEHTIHGALCLVLPSRREGYGLVVAEALALGTPSVVVAGPDNAAVELVEEGENGAIARSASPEDLGEAILRVHRGGAELRRSTRAWYERNRERLSIEASLEAVVEAYTARHG